MNAKNFHLAEHATMFFEIPKWVFHVVRVPQYPLHSLLSNIIDVNRILAIGTQDFYCNMTEEIRKHGQSIPRLVQLRENCCII